MAVCPRLIRFAGEPEGIKLLHQPTAGLQARNEGIPFAAPLRILTVPSGPGREMAIAHNRYDRTYTAVARLRVPGLGLADSARRDQRVAGWGGLLAGLCTEGNPIIRVQAWQDDVVRAPPPALRRRGRGAH